MAGAISVTAGLILLVYAIVKAQDYGWASGKTLGLGVVAVVLLAAFVMIELRSKAPLVRLGIFRIRSLTGGNLAMLPVAAGCSRCSTSPRSTCRRSWATARPGRLGVPAVHRGIVIGASPRRR